MAHTGGTLLTLPSHTLSALRTQLDLSDDDLVVVLRTDRRTVDSWRTGERIPQGRGRESLRKLEELKEQLLQSLGEEVARDWLHSPSGYFGGLTPLQALRGGGIDVVPQLLAAIESLETGAAL